MKNWTQLALQMVTGLLGNRRRQAAVSLNRRPRKLSAVESLERREVPTATSVIPFATIPASITASGQSAQVVLHFSAGQITSDRSAPVLIGFYAKPATGSAVVPQISEVDGFAGPLTRVSIPERGGLGPTKALFIAAVDRSPDGSQNLTVKISSPNGNLGAVSLEAFLPGDVQGDGTVNAIDLTHVQAIYGSAAGQSNYDPASDFNFDGHVGCIDRRLTQLNLGAHVAYTPAAAASIPTPAPVVTPAVPATPTVQATPVVVAPVAVTPTVAVTPVATPTVAVTPVALTPTVTTTPVALTTAVPATPITVTTQQPATTSVAPVQAVPIQLIPAPAASTTTTTNAQTTGATPIYLVPVSAPASPTYYTTTGTTPTYYTTASSPTTVPVSTASSQVPVYYYGQPVGTSSPTATSSTPVYYYNQPIVQGPVLNSTPTMGTSPLYYYGQPLVPTPTTTQVSPQAHAS